MSHAVPSPTETEIAAGLAKADGSPRRRFPQILHRPGEAFNRVINYMLSDSYMQPHHHPGAEKIEHIHLLRGRAAVLYFDDAGRIRDVLPLERPGSDIVEVPAFTWHTYVMLADHTITYETMMGVYEPDSWKAMASWAPPEGGPEARAYLDALKEAAKAKLK